MQTLKETRRRKKAPPAQFTYINGVAILKSDVVRNENGAFAVLSWHHSRYALPVSRHYCAAQPNAGRDVSFFSVISTTSLWHLRLWRQWDEGICAYVGIEPIVFNVFIYCTYCNALFILFFLRCLPQVKVQKRMVHSRRLLAALLTDRARRCEDWRRGSVIWQWVKPRVYRLQALCAGVELIENVGRSPRRMVHSRRLLAALLTDRARRSEDWRRVSVIWQWMKHRVYRLQALCAGVELIENVGRSPGGSKIAWNRYYV